MDETTLSIIMEVASTIVDHNIDLSTKFAESQPMSTCTNNVNAYSCETLSVGLLFMEFKDAIRESDSDRVSLVPLSFSIWKKEYSINPLSQYHLVLPERLAEWSKSLRSQYQSAVTCTWNT